MKLKKNYSLFVRVAETLTGAGRVAAVLLVMLFSMTAQTAWAESATVTQATFSNFFDANGILLDAVTSDELIFQGDFSGSDLVNYIVLDRAITITGDNAVLNNMGFGIAANGVTLKNVTLKATTSLGDLIYLNGCNVTLDNISVTYNAPADAEAKAIFATNAENFKLINSEIIFTGADPGSNHYRGLEVSNCDGAIIDNNTISAVFPAVPVDWGEMGTIDQDLVLAVGIQGGEDVEFTNNIVTVNTNGAVGSYPTIDAVMIYSANDILIKGNDITHLDTTPEESARYYYSLDIYSTTGIVEANDIIVNTTAAGVNRAGTAYAVQVAGPSTVTIIDNNLTAISKGPVAGIYATNWSGAANLTVENNTIDVTGYATTGNYALVAGIEAEIDVLKAYGNTITVANGADYDDANQVIGVGIDSSWFYGETSADIKDNNMIVDGQYAVYYAVAATATVTGNALYAHELTGDDAVYIKSGDNNTVENNFFGYVLPKTGGITDAINDKLKGKTVNIVFNRTFEAILSTGESKASTLCLPFDLEKPSTTTVGTFYTFGGVSENSGEYVVTMNEVTATTLTAGTPYMIKPATTDPITFQNTAYAVPSTGFTTAGMTTDANGWEFRGTYQEITWPDGQTRLYAFAAANFKKSDGELLNDVGAFRRFDYGHANPFRCYLWAPDHIQARSVNRAGNKLPESMKVILVSASGETTGIGTLDNRTGEVTFADEWYSLDGQKLDGKPTKKGLYINKGNKVVIK
jgi:hypothetical protein